MGLGSRNGERALYTRVGERDSTMHQRTLVCDLQSTFRLSRVEW